MTNTDTEFTGSVPDIYDEYMVPLIFADYAEELASRVAVSEPRAVLETAAGSGVVTRALAPKLSANVHYVVTDLNQPMLDRARRQQGHDDRITWQQANALELPFDDNLIDVVCCQFGVMFFPDRVTRYQEAKRVLRPGGHFIFNVWDRIEENVFTDTAMQALGEHFPHDPPSFMARTPHGYNDIDQIRRDVEKAGLSCDLIETRDGVSRAPSAFQAATALCQGTPMRAEIEKRGDLQAATKHVATRLAEAFGHGEIEGKIQAHVIVASRQ